uniref:Peroxisomal membrane protein PEX14 n=1 Tax=Aegilops tauschii TaxID=37682 RepID=M8AXN9_AEGTA
MADPPASSPADEARDPGSSEAAPHGSSTSQDTKEQEDMKGEAAVATSEPVREELVQSAVSFLSHPKVVASSDVQRRSFLENKGLTMDEIEEAFRRLLSPPSNSTNSNMCESQGSPDPETLTPVVPRHPKSYMEDINDEPPNPDQPISKPSMAPKPKPWEKQGQQSSGLDLKAHTSNPSESSSGVQTDGTSQATGSNNSSGHGDLMLTAEPATGSEAPVDGVATSPKQ